jgi:hypothetical protein
MGENIINRESHEPREYQFKCAEGDTEILSRSRKVRAQISNKADFEYYAVVSASSFCLDWRFGLLLIIQEKSFAGFFSQLFNLPAKLQPPFVLQPLEIRVIKNG